MAGLHNLIELERKLRVPGERTVPFPVFVDDPAKLPLRQLEFEQGQCGVGPSVGFDQPIDPQFRGDSARGEAPACFAIPTCAIVTVLSPPTSSTEPCARNAASTTW